MDRKIIKPIVMSALSALAFGAVGTAGTFALFTDNTTTQVSVAAGKIQLTTEASISSVWEYGGYTGSTPIQTSVVDSDSDGIYVNSIGGITKVDTDGIVKLQNWAPGDGARILVSGDNTSNVKTKMRIRATMSGQLSPALTMKVYDGNGFSNLLLAATGSRTVVSDWVEVNAETNPNGFGVEISFPDHDNGELKFGSDNKDNQYQNKSASIQLTYEVVQANANVGMTLLEQANTILASKEIEDGVKNATMYEALEDLGATLKARILGEEGASLVYGIETDSFYEESAVPAGEEYKYFKSYASMPTSQTFSVYANGWSTADTAITLNGIGFDIGDSTGVTSVTYNGGASAKEVTIRTNDPMCDLTVNAPYDVVNHYGAAGYTKITSVASSSYHEFGSSSFLRVAHGRVALEQGSDIQQIHFDYDSTLGFNGIIVAYDASIASLPTFSRDIVPAADMTSGKLVFELQKGTDEVESSDFIWLYNDGLVEEIKVTSSSESVSSSDNNAAVSGDSKVAQAAADLGNTGTPGSVTEKGLDAEKLEVVIEEVKQANNPARFGFATSYRVDATPAIANATKAQVDAYNARHGQHYEVGDTLPAEPAHYVHEITTKAHFMNIMQHIMDYTRYADASSGLYYTSAGTTTSNWDDANYALDMSADGDNIPHGDNILNGVSAGLSSLRDANGVAYADKDTVYLIKNDIDFGGGRLWDVESGDNRDARLLALPVHQRPFVGVLRGADANNRVKLSNIQSSLDSEGIQKGKKDPGVTFLFDRVVDASYENIRLSDMHNVNSANKHEGAFVGLFGCGNNTNFGYTNIHYLNFENCIVDASCYLDVDENASAFIAAGRGYLSITFTDCVNNANLTCNDKGAGAFLAGSMLNGWAPASNAAPACLKMVRCVNNGNIQAKYQVGSFTGYAGTAASRFLHFEDCVNNGNVKVVNNDGRYGIFFASGSTSGDDWFANNGTYASLNYWSGIVNTGTILHPNPSTGSSRSAAERALAISDGTNSYVGAVDPNAQTLVSAAYARFVVAEGNILDLGFDSQNGYKLVCNTSVPAGLDHVALEVSIHTLRMVGDTGYEYRGEMGGEDAAKYLIPGVTYSDLKVKRIEQCGFFVPEGAAAPKSPYADCKSGANSDTPVDVFMIDASNRNVEGYEDGYHDAEAPYLVINRAAAAGVYHAISVWRNNIHYKLYAYDANNQIIGYGETEYGYDYQSKGYGSVLTPIVLE